MFSVMDKILNGTQTLVVREEIRIPSDRVAGADIIRIDDLGRRCVAVPAGQPIPPHITLTEREKAMVKPAPMPVRRTHENGSYRLTGW